MQYYYYSVLGLILLSLVNFQLVQSECPTPAAVLTYCQSNPDVCGANGKCVDVGTNEYSCTCDTGYEFVGGTCNKIQDYCNDNPDVCGVGICSSLPGNLYSCDCGRGYEFNGETCQQLPTYCDANPNPCGLGICQSRSADEYMCICYLIDGPETYDFDGVTCSPIDIEPAKKK